MSLQTRLADFILAVGTDYKQLRTWISGSSTGDLTGLSTTVKSSLVSAINEVNAKPSGAPPTATESVSGALEVATQAEMTTGASDAHIVTPLKHRVDSDARYQLKSTNLTNLANFTTSTSTTLSENSDTVLATQKSVKAYADALLDANNAYVYKGVIDASTNPNYPAASAGHTYKISVAGRIGGASGPVVEVGDSVTALVDGSVAGNHATVGANWIIQQTNIDGAVVGPATSTAGNIVTFSGTTGKVISDSGLSAETDVALTSNADTRLPTSKAVRAYVANATYTKAEIGNPETDLVAAYTSAKA